MKKGDVAVITGASSGIGAALADMLAREGVNLVLGARRKEMLERVAERSRSRGVSVWSVECDVTDRSAAESLVHMAVKQTGGIDILVNNAGRGHLGDVEDTTDDVIEHLFALNVFALWYTCRPALAQMKKQGSGHIMNVASMAGKIGFPLNSAYVAAKHACVGFTHALRLELAGTGVQASVVCPGGVLTEWAQVTEGMPMLPLFSESGPLIKKMAVEQGVNLPPIEGVMSAERVAQKIVDCLKNPTAEVYTHAGSREFVVLSAQSREDAEKYQMPVALAEREVYDRMKIRGGCEGARTPS
jgi:short-subunit dehydrogenase